jgi:ABC-type transport system involved in multi-copper enzyme maturation permease subunit
MIWLTWRQFRTQALVALAVLGAAAIYFVITGIQMRNSYNADLASCNQPTNNQCDLVLGELQASYNGASSVFQMLLIAAPGLIGIFWGAPLVAAEYERGTHQLAWNQSVTVNRWLAVKLAALGLAAVATAGLFSLLLTWWSSPLDRIGDSNRFDWNAFSTRNVVPLGYAAFTFALGALLGLLIRRVLPAMALTLAVFIGLQAVFAAQIRPNLLPLTTVSDPIDSTLVSQAQGIEIQGNPTGDRTFSIRVAGPPGAWIRSESDAVDSSGQRPSFKEVGQCFQPDGGFVDMTELGSCLAPYKLHIDVAYEPASNYWPLQWFETGIYLALAALFGGACFWRIRRVRN